MAVPGRHERFWTHGSFAVVGHSSRRGFPVLTYRGLKAAGKRVIPVDPSVAVVEGDRTVPDLASLPEPVDAVVIEVPKDETRDRVAEAADAGLREVWLHMGTDTPEALDLARRRGLDVHSGTCAVMYLTPGFSYHAIHRWIMRLSGRY